jgi:hypothetical protein
MQVHLTELLLQLKMQLMCFGIETAKSFDGAVIATQNAIYVFSN